MLSSGDMVLSFLADNEQFYKVRVDLRNEERLVGSIFLGKVKRLAKGMDGVFVDIGLKRDAYLPMKAGDSYKVGDKVIVQLIREAEEYKGAKLTDKIKLVGKYLIYFPNGKDLKCSLKLKEEDKNRLSLILSEILQNEGVIVRSTAVKTSAEAIKKELDTLKSLWHEVQKKAKLAKKPKLLLEAPPNYIKLIQEHWYEIEEIVCDDPELWNRIVSFLEDFEPELLGRTVYAKNLSSYAILHNIHHLINRLLSKTVWLKSGGFIVIEETEAFVAIDVNSGDPTGSCHEENALKTNLEAAEEIARQIVLRDLGGIILVDFIDMKKSENKKLVIDKLIECFGDEACYVKVYGFTKLGILEMVRKKTGKSVPRMLSDACPLCSGKGFIKSTPLLWFEISKDINMRMHKKSKLEVNPIRKEEIERILKQAGFTHIVVEPSEDTGIDVYNISNA